MKEDMKVIMESWRKEVLSEQVSFKTVGDLKTAIKAAELAIKSPKAKEQMKDSVKSLAIALVKDAIPGANVIGTALEAGSGLFGVVKAVYMQDDSKNISPGLKSMNIDDDLSAVVDDKIELQFLKYLSKTFGKLPDDTPIDSLDMEKLLTEYIKKKYGGTTVQK